MLGLLRCMSLDLVPSRQFAATQHLGRFGGEADIDWAAPSQNRIYDGVDAPRRHRCAKVEVLSTT